MHRLVTLAFFVTVFAVPLCDDLDDDQEVALLMFFLPWAGCLTGYVLAKWFQQMIQQLRRRRLERLRLHHHAILHMAIGTAFGLGTHGMITALAATAAIVVHGTFGG